MIRQRPTGVRSVVGLWFVDHRLSHPKCWILSVAFGEVTDVVSKAQSVLMNEHMSLV
jgi:hypothetical protein